MPAGARRTCRGLLCGLALIAAGVAASPSEARPVFGIVPQDGALPPGSDLDLMPKAGISAVRVLVHWPAVEPTQGKYDWTGTDQVVRQATSHGIQPFPFLSGTPEWVARQDGHNCHDSGCWNFGPSSDQTRAEYANFAAAAVARYGPGGSFWTKPSALRATTGAGAARAPISCTLLPSLCPPNPPPPPAIPPLDSSMAPCQCTVARPITTWQIWNEQNSPKYYAPKPKPGKYARLLAAAGNAIHARDPSADVVVGGMWGPANAKKVVMPVTTYLHRMYRVGGIEQSFDSIALHPYASNARNSSAAVRLAHRALKREHDATAGIWITELGWATGGPRSNPYVKSRRGQAKELGRALKSFKHRSRKFNIRGVFWYSWQDKAGGNVICDWCGHAGLRAKDGSAKPSWRAFRHVARR